jgi:hypothetical protein
MLCGCIVYMPGLVLTRPIASQLEHVVRKGSLKAQACTTFCMTAQVKPDAAAAAAAAATAPAIVAVSVLNAPLNAVLRCCAPLRRVCGKSSSTGTLVSTQGM